MTQVMPVIASAGRGPSRPRGARRTRRSRARRAWRRRSAVGLRPVRASPATAATARPVDEVRGEQGRVVGRRDSRGNAATYSRTVRVARDVVEREPLEGDAGLLLEARITASRSSRSVAKWRYTVRWFTRPARRRSNCEAAPVPHRGTRAAARRPPRRCARGSRRLVAGAPGCRTDAVRRVRSLGVTA